MKRSGREGGFLASLVEPMEWFDQADPRKILNDTNSAESTEAPNSDESGEPSWGEEWGVEESTHNGRSTGEIQPQSRGAEGSTHNGRSTGETQPRERRAEESTRNGQSTGEIQTQHRQSSGETRPRIEYNEENKGMAIRDLDEAICHLHKSKRRKFAPWYSAPTEMLIIALQPTYISRPGLDKGALGTDATRKRT